MRFGYAKEKLKEERNIVGRAESLAKNKCFPTHYCCKVNNIRGEAPSMGQLFSNPNYTKSLILNPIFLTCL